MYWEGKERGRGNVGDTVEAPGRMDQENTIEGGGRGDVLMCLMHIIAQRQTSLAVS